MDSYQRTIFMFDDLLGKTKKDPIDVDRESLIKALEDNVAEKQKMIEDLVSQVVELERRLEDREQGYI